MLCCGKSYGSVACEQCQDQDKARATADVLQVLLCTDPSHVAVLYCVATLGGTCPVHA